MKQRRDRAWYYRQRRLQDNYKIFTVEVDRKKLERFEEVLRVRCQTKVDWLNEKIDEVLGEE